MEIERNKEIVIRLQQELWGHGNLAVANELLSPKLVPIFQKAAQKWKQISPDLQTSIEDILAEGDRVAVRITGQGTHLGKWRGLEATGRGMIWKEICIYRVENGKITEYWCVSDRLGTMEQIGVTIPGWSGV